MYFAPMSETDQNLGRLTDNGILNLGAVGGSLVTNLTPATGGDCQPAWAVRNTVAPFDIIGFETVDQIVALPRMATQRRRRTDVRAIGPP